jgi:prephenate dehydratase
VKVAYQGEPGAFSEDAVRAAYPQAEPLPCENIRDAFQAVADDRAAVGVVPLENSQAGSINETYELLLDADRLRIVGEVVVPVDHALLALPGTELHAITRVYSHPQALAQSEEFLRGLRVELVAVHDTAGAARMVAQSGRNDRAAVASVRAGELVGLVPLAERIQTHKDNATKFAAIGDVDTAPSLGDARKTTMVLAVADQPGSLYRCLQPFAERGINLTKLESRPRRGAPFEYVFYVDIEAPSDAPEIVAALEEVGRHTSLLKVLGSYPVLSR